MPNPYLAEIAIHQSDFSFPCVRHQRDYIQGNLELREMGVMGDLVLAGSCRAILSDVADSLPTGGAQSQHFYLDIGSDDPSRVPRQA